MKNNAHSHKVTVVVQSYMDGPDVQMEVRWEPTLSDADIAGLGYVPAAYRFVDTALVTAAWMAQGAAEIEQEDISHDRVIN